MLAILHVKTSPAFPGHALVNAGFPDGTSARISVGHHTIPAQGQQISVKEAGTRHRQLEINLSPNISLK